MTISYGMLSTHAPTRCGLATFNSALAAELFVRTGQVGIVRVTGAGDDPLPTPDVIHTWTGDTAGGWRAAADALNSFDVAVIQHEYGIYPGADGAEVLYLLDRLTVPAVVVLHTVLAHPSAGQRAVLEQVVAAADAVVTMTSSGRDRLLVGYDVDAARVSVIPHGVTAVDGPAPARTPQAHLLTWGLLGPGKGIEWALRALARLRDLDPAPHYTVAGQTHPKVLAREGDAYREHLHRLGSLLGVSDAVTYRPDFLDAATLRRLIASADVVVLPYDSREQITSGVLVEAVAAGVQVVATAFPHAVELLSDGVGQVVPHQDAGALAAAIRLALTGPPADPSVPPTLRWPAVAECYEDLAHRLIHARSITVDAR